jgi:hypothetical protein
MKKQNVFKKSISLVAILFLFITNLAAQNNPVKSLEGIWLGKIEIQNAAKLRMAVVVNADGTAALNIIDQATGNIPVDEVTHNGDSVSFKLNQLGIAISGCMNTTKDSILCMFKQRGGGFALNMGRVDELPRLNRPQTPKAPFGYASEEIEIYNQPAGVKLQGTLTLPNSSRKVPAVVLLTGSGQQNRDEEFSEHKPFWVIADHLTRNGIAVLRMDDRGLGGSTGDFKKSTTGDFATDALAAVEYLKTRTEIDAARIGLVGHSEGGSTAVIASRNSAEVKFMIALSGGMANFGDIHIKQVGNQLRMQKVHEENIKLDKEWREKLNEIVREPTDSLVAAGKMWSAYRLLTPEMIKTINWPEGRMNHMVSQLLSPWWRYAISLDVKSQYIGLNCPALLLFGEKDKQIDAAENMAIITEAVKTNHKTNISIRLIEGVNHMYQTADTGSEYEYFQIEETFSPSVLNMLSEWILKSSTIN